VDTNAVSDVFVRDRGVSFPAPPGAPGGVVAAAGDGTAAVSWTAPAVEGASPIASYTVLATPGGATASTSAPSTSLTIAGLTNGTTYTFTVTATNNDVTGPASAASAPVTPQAGNPPPAAVSATASTTDSTTVNTSTDPAT